MNRITNADLDNLCNQINKLNGTPLTYGGIQEDGKFVSNIDHYHIDSAYGGYKLVQLATDGGGTRDITHSGFTTKRELYNEMRAIITGLEMKS